MRIGAVIAGRGAIGVIQLELDAVIHQGHTHFLVGTGRNRGKRQGPGMIAQCQQIKGTGLTLVDGIAAVAEHLHLLVGDAHRLDGAIGNRVVGDENPDGPRALSHIGGIRGSTTTADK